MRLAQRLRSVLMALALLIGLTSVAPSVALAGGSDFAPGQVIVELPPGFTIEQFHTRYATSTIEEIAGRRFYLVTIPAGTDEASFVTLLRTDLDVASADLNTFAEDVNPEGSTQSIFLSITQAAYLSDVPFNSVNPLAPQSAVSGSGVVAAVLDSGVDAGHPQLVGRVVAGGVDFIDQDTDPADTGDGVDNNSNGAIDETVGHGTLVAGIIARVAPGAGILPVRVLGSDGESTTFALAQGLFFAMDAGADVINASLGVSADPAILRSAAAEAQARKVLIIAAAGNDDRTEPARSPALLREAGVVGVAATTTAGVRASFSNFGSWVSISAPGVAVGSLTPGGGYGSASGTSFAAPFITGAAALLREVCPDSSLAQLRAALEFTSWSIAPSNPGFETALGSGFIDVSAAVLLASSNCHPACPADYNRDTRQNFDDIVTLLSVWGNTYPPGTLGVGDGNGDLIANFDDMTLLLSVFGDRCE